ncbi:hypothetical protein DL765_006358 [Monosporascus sp. GIB2]|nr:hypothetical protein DL765_006358 [Monosporascus sp. GIB2]
MNPMIPPTEKQDRLLYLKTAWQQDILSGVVFGQHENTSCCKDLRLRQVQKYILTGARQISHRYAKLRILQVGASSIVLVQAMHQELGKAIDSYTILDTSDRAIEDMKQEMISDDLNIRFGVNKIARDVRTLDKTTSQRPIDLGLFDLIILPKAYKEQPTTLNAIRSLLKPGGFLLMMVTGLHLLLGKSKLVLWVTPAQETKPRAKAVRLDLCEPSKPKARKRFCSSSTWIRSNGNESLAAKSFLRLIGGVLMRDDGSMRLWTVESEVSVQGGRLLIPRVLFDEKRNDRLNSLRRRVKARAPFKKQPGNLVRPIDPSELFSPSKTYILVDLNGHIGQSIARWMVKRGVRHIVITSRTMPPIEGLANVAMVQSNCFFPDLTYDALQEVLMPKVDRSAIPDEVFSDHDPDFFLLSSSISAVTGQPFQANSDAANRFMTGLAFQRRVRNLPASVIDFGPVIGLGFIQKIDSSGGSDVMISTLRGLGYMLVSERGLHHLLIEAIFIGKSNESPGITAGLGTVSGNAPFWHKSLLFSHIIQKP